MKDVDGQTLDRCYCSEQRIKHIAELVPDVGETGMEGVADSLQQL